MTWEELLNPTYNEITPGAVLPTQGASIAASSTGAMRSVQNAVPSASTATPMGNPVAGMVTFAVLIGVIMFVVHRFGGESDDFSNVRASAYNILIVSLIAMAGVPIWRLAIARSAAAGVPGASHLNSYVAVG